MVGTAVSPPADSQILPAYAEDGIVRVFHGSTDATLVEDFIAQLLYHCVKRLHL